MATIYDSESELPEYIARLVADSRRRQQEWISGAEGDIAQIQHPQMTIYGPFGGLIGRMGADLSQAQVAMRSQFKGGTSEAQFVRAIESGDVVVIVLLEKSLVRFADSEEPQPWILRTTEVYQRDGDAWQRLHRHADPLARRRPLEETLALLVDSR